jgi:hypothetical protein
MDSIWSATFAITSRRCATTQTGEFHRQNNLTVDSTLPLLFAERNHRLLKEQCSVGLNAPCAKLIREQSRLHKEHEATGKGVNVCNDRDKKNGFCY